MATNATSKNMKPVCCKDEPVIKTGYNKILVTKQPGSFFPKHETKQVEGFMCSKCVEDLVNCQCCGEVFKMEDIVDGYDDSKLTKIVQVCKTCYMLEACSSCRYLGGANPCRWCR